MGRAQPMDVCFQHQHGAEPFLEEQWLELLVPGVVAQLNSAESEQCLGLCAQSSVTKGHAIEAVEERFSWALTLFSAICNRFHLGIIWLPAGFLLSNASPAQLNPVFSPPLLPVYHLGIAVLLLLLIYGEISLCSHPCFRARAHKVPREVRSPDEPVLQKDSFTENFPQIFELSQVKYVHHRSVMDG